MAGITTTTMTELPAGIPKTQAMRLGGFLRGRIACILIGNKLNQRYFSPKARWASLTICLMRCSSDLGQMSSTSPASATM